MKLSPLVKFQKNYQRPQQGLQGKEDSDMLTILLKETNLTKLLES